MEVKHCILLLFLFLALAGCAYTPIDRPRLESMQFNYDGSMVLSKEDAEELLIYIIKLEAK